MNFRGLLEKTDIDLEKIYHNIKNPYNADDTNISGVDYKSLDNAEAPKGTMFYAINVNGKSVSTRAKSNLRCKEVMIAGKEYYVTNSLSYSGKKFINELMIARKEKVNEDVSNVSDDAILEKIAKKAFGKGFSKIEFDTERAEKLIILKDSYVKMVDLKSFEINSTSYKLGDVISQGKNIAVSIWKK